MAFNVPAFTTDDFSFGPGVLFIGAAGATPLTDVGAVRSGAEFAVTREILEVRQGSPATVVQNYVLSEEAILRVTGIEWNLSRLKDTLGSGVVTLNPAGEDTFEFGGSLNLDEVALRFKHELPAGTTVILDIWTAQAMGEFTITFGDDIHEFPYMFKALETLVDWEGNSLPANKRLFKITKQNV